MQTRKGYFNWKLAIVLVLAVAVVAGTAVGLRQYQRAGRGEAALKAGNAAYEKGDWDEAAANLGRYIGGHQEDVPTLLKYADAQLKKRPQKPSNFQQAVAAYRIVLRFDKTNTEAARQLIEVYLAVGSPGEAELIGRRYMEDNPGSYPEIRLMLGAALAALGRFDQAQLELEAVIDANSEHITAYEALGMLAEQQPEKVTHPAAYWFDLAVQKNPKSAPARISRAGFSIRRGDLPKAIADLESAESLDLSETSARIRLAQRWIQAGRLDKAQANLEALSKTALANVALWQTWAELALRSQSQKTMQEVAQKGLDVLGGLSWDFMPTAAELFIQSGQLDQASQCLAKMREKDLQPPTTAFLEGLLWQRRDNPLEAIKSWQRAMSLGYKSPQVRLLLASAYTQQGDMQSALVQLQTACSEYPNVPTCHLTLARHMARIGDWAGARQYAQAVMRVLPDNVEAKVADIESQIQMLSGQGADGADPGWASINQQLTALEGMAKAGNAPLFLRIQVALRRGDMQAAQGLLARIVPVDPAETLRVALTSAEVLAAGGKTQEAIRTMEAAAAQFPDAVEPARFLAILLLGQADQGRCEAVLKQALGRMRGPAAQRDLGLLLCAAYERWTRADEAIAFLEDLAKKQQDTIWIKRRLLDYPKVLSDTSKAQRLVDQVKKLDEAGWQWRYDQARVWFAMQDFSRNYSQLVGLLKDNLSSNPNDQESRKLLAAAYERAGEMQLAMSTYREALDRSPEDLSIIVPTVSALYRAQEYEQADRILQQAAGRKLAHPALQGLQLQQLLRQGEFVQAGDMLEQLWSRDPNNPRIGLSLAVLKIQQGRFDEAYPLLAQLRKLDPNSLPIASSQVQLFLRQKRSQEAVQVCDGLVALRKDAASHLLRARTLSASGQADAAARDFGKAVELESRNPEVWVARSDFYRVAGKAAEAIADMDRALALEPNNVAIQKLAIPLFLASRDNQRAAQAGAMLDKALQSRPDDADLQLLKVRHLMDDPVAPSIAEAESRLDRLTSNWPKTREAWVLWGDVLLNQADAGKALDVVLRGLAHNPNDRALLLLKARAEATRSPLLAVQTLKGIRELDPNNTNLVLILATAHMNSGEPGKAVTLLQGHAAICSPADRLRCQTALVGALYRNGDKAGAQALQAQLAQSSPDDPAVLFSQVRFLREDQRWDEAKTHISEWIKGHPQDITTPMAIAVEMGNGPDPQAQRMAEQILRDLLARQPESLRILGLLAQILQRAGRNDEAVEVCRKIVDLDPKGVIAMNNLAWLLCEDKGNFQEALALANRGLEIAPDYLDLLDTRGVIYYRLGRFDKAVEDLTRSVQLYPAGAPAGVGTRFHLARAYAKLNRKPEAVKLIKEALELQNRIGGLAPQELAEARQMLEELQR